MTETKTRQRETIEVFRVDDVEPMKVTGEEPSFFAQSDLASKKFKEYYATGIRQLIDVRVLVDVPGLLMFHAILKPGWRIPLHSHDGAGMYYVISGSVHYGNITLKAREGIYQPAGASYQLTAGEDGAEILEIRNGAAVETTWVSNNEKYWNEQISAAQAAVLAWKTQT